MTVTSPSRLERVSSTLLLRRPATQHARDWGEGRRERDRERERKRVRERDTERDTERNRYRDREKQIQRQRNGGH